MKPSAPILVMMFSLFLICGCGRPAAVVEYTPSEAHQNLRRILREENQLEVTTREFAHALWIYLPVEESFFEMKAKAKLAAAPSPMPVTAPAIHFLKGEFTDNRFDIQYDIGPSKVYARDPGYTSSFSGKYQEDQQKILGAVFRAYADFEEVPGENRFARRVPGDIDFAGEAENARHKEMVHNYVKTEKAPGLFVIVTADIKNGLATRVFVYLKDLKRAYTDQTFHEEYARRVVSEQPFGDPKIIGDKTGRHAGFRDISMPEFLAKQIVYRVNFKYTQSSFPPGPDARKQLTQIAAEVVQGYDFNGFDGLRLADLGAKTTHAISKENLKDFVITPPKLPGKLHHLTFEIKSPEGEEENF